MTTEMADPSWAESPVFIDSKGETLFGILAEPVGKQRGVAVIHLRGGNQGPSSGRNRTSALLCRRLTAHGFHALRFDYHGVGESTGEIHHFRLAEPFKDDVEVWAAWLRELGLSRIALIGECFGARTAIACHDLPGLEAVVLVAAPVRDAEKVGGATRPLVRHRSLLGYLRRAFNRKTMREMMHPSQRRKYWLAAQGALRAKPYRKHDPGGTAPGWVSTDFLHGLEALASRELPVLFVHGTRDPGFEDFVRAKSGTLGKTLNSSPQMGIDLIDGRISACADANVQEPAIDLMRSWLSNVLADVSVQT